MADKNKIIPLMAIDNLGAAEDVKRILKENDIETMLESQNPASSALHAIAGQNLFETIYILVNESDFETAEKIIQTSPYQKYLGT